MSDAQTIEETKELLPQKERVIEEEDRFRKMVIIAGPTACGKTELSLLVANKVKGEIISADSMQIYRGMDIGTAKASLEEQRSVPHHLVDIRDVHEPFSVVDYFYEASRVCDEIQRRGHIPIVVGGAGFYLHALLYGPPAGPPSVSEVRKQLEDLMGRLGPEEMYERLNRRDPYYAETITPHDRQKIVRALEIIELTGAPVSSFSWKMRSPTVRGDVRCYFVHRPREILYQRVEQRCQRMLDEGLVQEVEELDQKGIRKNPSARMAIGYRQCLDYLDSKRSKEDWERLVETFERASRHYVKRQFTWFRKEPLFAWVNVEDWELEAVADRIAQEVS